MDRMIDMKKSSTVFLDGLLNERVGKAGKYFEKEKDAWIDIFRSEMRVLADMRKENEKNLVISSLCSSIVTGSNAYQIAWYDDNIYLDTNPACIFYVPEFLFRDLEEDILEIRKHLQKDYIRLMEYEVEEIRRGYMRRLYAEGKHFFTVLIKSMGRLYVHDMDIWFGEYMRYVDLIGRI